MLVNVARPAFAFSVPKNKRSVARSRDILLPQSGLLHSSALLDALDNNLTDLLFGAGPAGLLNRPVCTLPFLSGWPSAPPVAEQKDCVSLFAIRDSMPEPLAHGKSFGKTF